MSLLASLLVALAPSPLAVTTPRAQDPAPVEAQEAEPTIEQVVAHYERSGVHLQVGPLEARLGAEATIAVPQGSYFLDADNARKWLEQNENLTSGKEVGALWHSGAKLADSWWVVFTFSKDGYVKDDDKDLDADAVMASMKEGNQAGNEERKKRGWPALHLLGWQKPPFYDAKTNNLTWSKLLESEGHQSINWSTRLLGREGVMSVDLVLSPEQLDSALPEYEHLLEGFRYTSGHTYAEFRSGDKIAEYGLAGLLTVGAGALALKTGLFAKLWKFLLLGAVAVGGFLKRLFTGKKKDGEPGSTTA